MQDRVLRFKCRLKKIFYKYEYKDKFLFSKDLMFRHGFFIRILGGKIVIKEGCFFNNYCSINSLSYIEIGKNCIFGEGVKIYDHNHKFDSEHITKQNGYTTGKIIIEDNVWIGSNVVILKGVNIGSNVVIGAGCVINKSIPSNSVVTLNSSVTIKNLN